MSTINYKAFIDDEIRRLTHSGNQVKIVSECVHKAYGVPSINYTVGTSLKPWVDQMKRRGFTVAYDALSDSVQIVKD